MDLPQLGHGRVKLYYCWINTGCLRQKEQKISVQHEHYGATVKMTELEMWEWLRNGKQPKGEKL